MNVTILKEDAQQFAAKFELAEQLRAKTFLVTGATGLIGSVLIRCLLELNAQKNLGIRIVAIVRNIDKAQKVFDDIFPLIDFRQVDIQEITANTIGDDVDYVIHLASPTASKFFVDYPVETLRTAIEGTTTVLYFAKAAHVKGMVYASSLEVYGSNDTDEWIDEEFQGYVNPTEVRSSYNMGKRAAECLCHAFAKEYDVPVTIARFTQVFGAGISSDENRVFAQFARSAVSNNNIELHTEGLSAKPYCYTIDAVSAMLYMLVKGSAGEAYNVANKNSYISIRDMAQMVCNHFNPTIQVVIVPKVGLGYAPITKLRLDTRKLEQLGWTPQYDLPQMFCNLIKYISNEQY